MQRTKSDECVPAKQEQNHHNVVANRAGDVLLKNTLLKSDHFPGCQNRSLLPLLEGAPNYRQVPELPVYGVAIPTVAGLRLVLAAIEQSTGTRPVLWHNMREEPVLYINGKPYVVRESNKPFANLEYTGIDRSRVEAMELRLKQDVLREAEMYGNQVLVAHESDDFQVVERWEPVTEVDVQTPLDVYKELADEGHAIDYLRVPVTDEKAPKEGDVELLLQRLAHAPPDAALVFNCQMGRGRTTTGMIIATMLLLRRQSRKLALCEAPQEGLPSWFVAPQSPLISPRSDQHRLDQELKAGRFGVVRSLLRVLEDGQAAKDVVDVAIDANSAMQNLREAIAGYRVRLTHESNEDKRNALLHVCLEYLERYYVLIAFSAYLMEPGFDPANPGRMRFGSWLAERPELYSVLQRMLRRNPLAAMAMHRDGLPRHSLQEDHHKEQEAAEDASAVLVANRSGAVLGPHTILKEDHFPGCQSPHLPPSIPGVPNFRGVGRVYGSALPTIQGIRAVLEQVGCSPMSSKEDHQTCALWYNMREEVTVYINGEPFVLREDGRPFKNMEEYTGIDAGRLELMEERLAEDVRREAVKHGRVLVAREVMSSAEQSSATIQDSHEVLSSSHAVMTPRQAYSALKEEGFHVNYMRTPLTDGAAPREIVFDTFYTGVSAASPLDPVIFNDQMGAGRTTTGMVIACMIRSFMDPGPDPMMSLDSEPRSSRGPAEGGPVEEGLQGLSPRSSVADEEEDPSQQASAKGVAAPGHATHASHASLQNLADTEDGKLEDRLEAAALREGEYVGVRRLTRSLETGDHAKMFVDEWIDACAAVINLRTAIMRYRKPRSNARFHRPEINVRHTAFKRGIAYLERYCLLIAFAAFLERAQATAWNAAQSFAEWMDGRPDVMQARTGIHQNPAGALLPVSHMAHPFLSNFDSQSNQHVELAEQRSVLSKRHGSTLTKRSILKGYHAAGTLRRAPAVEGVADLRQVQGVPVFSVGSFSVQGLRNLLRHLGARPGGPAHFVVSDLREELVVYINGWPYLRRELEMPAAALHHAGIRAVKLEELERRLRNDVMHESMQWEGQVLLHREVPLQESSELLAKLGETTIPADLPAGRRAAAEGSPAPKASGDQEDVTRKEDDNHAGGIVSAFWESLGGSGDVDVGLASPLEVYQSLAAEGFQLSYRRIPLSRERTPEAADLDTLHSQMQLQPEEGKRVVHLIVSRTATGSSVRFVAAFASSYLNSPWGQRQGGEKSPMAQAGSESSPAWLAWELGNSNLGPAEASNGRDRSPDHKRQRSAAAHQGEYRGIMNLLRLLPGGTEAKLLVDNAIDSCTPIGNVRDDIYRCKEAVEVAALASSSSASMYSSAAAARRLGLHYLTRYFFLITFQAYMAAQVGAVRGPRAGTFARWVADRRELKHLISSLSLEPAI